jgi:hypothetical protein
VYIVQVNNNEITLDDRASPKRFHFVDHVARFVDPCHLQLMNVGLVNLVQL